MVQFELNHQRKFVLRHPVELHTMSKELALIPKYAQYPNPTRNPNFLVKPDPKSKSPSRHGLATRAFWQKISKDICIKWHSLRLAFVLSWSSDEDINCKSISTNVVYLPLVELTRRFLVAPRRTSWHIFHLFEFLGCFKHQNRVLDSAICKILNGVLREKR